MVDRGNRLGGFAVLKLFVLALTGLALLGMQVQAASGSVEAAKLKKCKTGVNSKRCKCPKGSTLVKKGQRKYRCKKKAPVNVQQGNGTTGNGNTGAPAGDPALTGPAQPQPVRDDAAFDAALSGTRLGRYEEGTYGYGRYAYNFLPNHQLLYCSYYYAGSTVEANRVGTWQVKEGYTATGVPGYTIGSIHIVGSDFDAVIGVEQLGTKSNVQTGNVSNVFTQGAFTRAAGGAVTNCSAIQ
jgi:hypothetical protein